MAIVLPSSGGGGGGVAPVCTQMVVDAVSTDSIARAWRMADINLVFDAVVRNLTNVDIESTEASVAFDNVDDSATLAGSASVKALIAASDYLNELGKASTEFVDYYTPSRENISNLSNVELPNAETSVHGFIITPDGKYLLTDRGRYTLETPHDASSLIASSYIAGNNTYTTNFSLRTVISGNGMVMLNIGQTGGTISRFLFEVPFDPSSIHDPSETITVPNSEAKVRTMEFGNSGALLYIYGIDNDQIIQCVLDDTWARTGGIASNTVLGSLQSPTNREHLSYNFSDDGTELHYFDTNNLYYKYNMPAWTIASATVDALTEATTFDFVRNMDQIRFSDNGSYLNVLKDGYIFSENLATPFDFRDSDIYKYLSQLTRFRGQSPSNLTLNRSGTYFIGEAGTNIIRLYPTSGHQIENAYCEQETGENWIGIDHSAGYMIFINTSDDIVYTKKYRVSGEVGSVLTNTDSAVNISGANSSAAQFNNDGTKLYLLENGSIDEYTISTPYDLRTLNTTPSHALDISGQSSNQEDFHWKPDGTEVYISDRSNTQIDQWTLSVAWDLSTATYTGAYNHNGVTGGQIYGVTLNSTGTKMYMTKSTMIYQFSLGTAWDITSASYDSKSIAEGGSYNLALIDNDQKLIGANDIFIFGTPGDVSTLTQVPDLDVSGDINTDVTCIRVKDDGTRLYIADEDGRILEYTMTAWDLSTASLNDTFDVTPYARYGTNLQFDISEDGTKLYVGFTASDSIIQFDMDAWDLSTATYSGKALKVTNAIEIFSDGDIIIADEELYKLTDEDDISTGVLVGTRYSFFTGTMVNSKKADGTYISLSTSEYTEHSGLKLV